MHAVIGGFQKISIPYHGWHLGIPRERGGFLDWNSEDVGGGGVTQFGIPKAWGAVSALNSVNFQRKDGESSA